MPGLEFLLGGALLKVRVKVPQGRLKIRRPPCGTAPEPMEVSEEAPMRFTLIFRLLTYWLTGVKFSDTLIKVDFVFWQLSCSFINMPGGCLKKLKCGEWPCGGWDNNKLLGEIFPCWRLFPFDDIETEVGVVKAGEAQVWMAKVWNGQASERQKSMRQTVKTL